ncbi:endo alpha-1,4 polygalactosaminidase [Amycolatopsis sp. NBC_00348]|uniref:endo alpha-1,4 polygalactosaminidase n=1 Tax=unclassified Amycolatopsis TaxID=2618356 RepID=UPI002E1682E6|nr:MULTISPECIES: endo alpha-1,4 polygalactosaminidase [unclassified Amycolatopsis]WSJ80996.1 endo alpha-1,4 polygalactosaminidase [Amycolatopsis sp. NBC_01307]
MTRNPSAVKSWFLAALAVPALTSACLLATAGASAAAVTLPPTPSAWDYQIGGAYTPPSGVKIVSRDHSDPAASGLYNICYINAFQVNEGDDGEWASDLLLRDANGNKVVDPDWHEALLDLRTADKRSRVAAQINGIVDSCAGKGFQAIEPDNYDSYERSKNLISTANAQDYIKLLSSHAHAKGLAIAQKNTVDLAANRVANGLDFAVAEECGQYTECDVYANAFGNRVVDVEYTSSGLSKACASWKGKISIVRRDEDVVPAGESGYVRKTC